MIEALIAIIAFGFGIWLGLAWGISAATRSLVSELTPTEQAAVMARIEARKNA